MVVAGVGHGALHEAARGKDRVHAELEVVDVIERVEDAEDDDAGLDGL